MQHCSGIACVHIVVVK